MVGPLSSTTPRPYIIPSWISPPKGGYFQSSPVGTTSICPSTATMSSPSPYSMYAAWLSTFPTRNPMLFPSSSAKSSAFLGPGPYGAFSSGSPATLSICTLRRIPSRISSFISSIFLFKFVSFIVFPPHTLFTLNGKIIHLLIYFLPQAPEKLLHFPGSACSLQYRYRLAHIQSRPLSLTICFPPGQMPSPGRLFHTHRKNFPDISLHP